MKDTLYEGGGVYGNGEPPNLAPVSSSEKFEPSPARVPYFVKYAIGPIRSELAG